MLTDAQWTMLEPLIEGCRPKGKTPPQDATAGSAPHDGSHPLAASERREVALCAC